MQMQTNINTRSCPINSNNTLRKPMLRLITEPGLVVFYDIQPGKGAGLFFQPRSPHGADNGQKLRVF